MRNRDLRWFGVLTITCIAFWFVVGIAIARAEEVTTTFYAGCREGTYINIRIARHDEADVVGKLEAGASFESAIDIQEGYQYHPDTRGWISYAQLTLDPPSSTEAIIQVDGRVALRKGPGTSYDRVAWFTNEQEIVVVGRLLDGSINWYKCKDDGYSGWIREDFISWK